MSNRDVSFSTEYNFKSFISQYNAIEDLDHAVKTLPKGVAIADYAVRDLLVIELKTLKSDPKQKIDTYLETVAARDDFPVFYGEINFRKLVSLLPDGKKIIEKLESKAFRQIESIMSKADKQIKSTIQYLNMDSRIYGTLIIINDLLISSNQTY